MSLKNIFDHTYYHIVNFFYDFEMAKISFLNKNFNKLTKIGFAKNIAISNNDSYNLFIERFVKHLNFITSIIFYNYINPFSWIPDVREKLVLHSCVINNCENYPEIKTIELFDTRFNQWDKLPNLQSLYYNADYFPDLNKISTYCPNLSVVIINCESHLNKKLNIIPLLKC